MSYLYHKALQTVNGYDLVSKGDRILVAVSGGPDSVALFRFLNELAGNLGLTIQIFHLNHLIRQEALNDAEFVRELGKKFNTPVHIERADVRKFAEDNDLSIQVGAREMRYKSMEDVARSNGLNKIATGHTKDDVTETFIMRVANGSGFRGLTGIPPKRDDVFIRPLIECSKEEIISWMDELGQKHVTDESNSSDKYYRNRIRNHVVPILKEEEIDEIVFQTCEIIRDDEGIKERRARDTFLEIASQDEYEISISIRDLMKETVDIQTRILRMCIEALSYSYREKPTIKQLDDVLRRFHRSDLSRLDLRGGISVCKEHERIVVFSRENDGAIIENELVIGRDNSISLMLNVKVELRDADSVEPGSGTNIVFMDESKIRWPLTARSFKPGDRFTPFGMKGTKKVKDFFIDEKIPKRRRVQTPIIEDREKIVWIAGYRLDERVRIDGSTDKVAVLKIEMRE